MPTPPPRRLVARFEALLKKAVAEDQPLRVAVVGAGASGVEVACALQYRCGGCGAGNFISHYAWNRQSSMHARYFVVDESYLHAILLYWRLVAGYRRSGRRPTSKAA